MVCVPPFPEEVLLYIYGFLPARTILRHERANKFFFHLLSTNGARFHSLDADLTVILRGKVVCQFFAAPRDEELKESVIQGRFRLRKKKYFVPMYILESDDNLVAAKQYFPALRTSLFRHFRPATVRGEIVTLLELRLLVPESVVEVIFMPGYTPFTAARSLLTNFPQIRHIYTKEMTSAITKDPHASKLEGITCKQFLFFGKDHEAYLINSQLRNLFVEKPIEELIIECLNELLKAWTANRRQIEYIHVGTANFSDFDLDEPYDLLDGLNVLELNVVLETTKKGMATIFRNSDGQLLRIKYEIIPLANDSSYLRPVLFVTIGEESKNRFSIYKDADFTIGDV